MVAPELQDHVTKELHKEAQVMKERRKLREERALTRTGSSSTGGQDKNLQSRLDRANNRIKELEKAAGGKDGGKGGRGAQGGRDGS